MAALRYFLVNAGPYLYPRHTFLSHRMFAVYSIAVFCLLYKRASSFTLIS